MSEQPEPVYAVTKTGDRELVTCTIGEHKGAARIFSGGLEEAKDRAKIQALAKWMKAQT